MNELNLREMRANMSRLDMLISEEGKLATKRHGLPSARISLMMLWHQFPDHTDSRQQVKTPK